MFVRRRNEVYNPMKLPGLDLRVLECGGVYLKVSLGLYVVLMVLKRFLGKNM